MGAVVNGVLLTNYEMSQNVHRAYTGCAYGWYDLSHDPMMPLTLRPQHARVADHPPRRFAMIEPHAVLVYLNPVTLAR